MDISIKIMVTNLPLSSISLGKVRLSGNVTVVSAFVSRYNGMCDFVGGFGTASFDRASSSKNCKNKSSYKPVHYAIK